MKSGNWETVKKTKAARDVAAAFSDMVHSHCAATGDTQADLAEELGITPGNFSSMLHSNVRIQADQFHRLALITGQPSGYDRLTRGIGFITVRRLEGIGNVEHALVSAVKEHAEAIAACSDATSCPLSVEKRANIKKELREARAALAELEAVIDSCATEEEEEN